ncbi:acetylxylan esterase [Maribellus comscasis]|uniref:Acetylxylan esterase n=1 Tax=Maribellus comscasis TaxID=2681766 RepID=A0A6I6K2J0_9BACT|nr:acetylxylan esterase [Maribellus comscasis]QGY46652.1 acetylxylan esterase [Maribellus comscasis]
MLKNNHLIRFFFAVLIVATTGIVCYAQNKPEDVAGIPVNYDESKTGTYTLPDPLVLQNGKKVTSGKTWIKKRRPEILQMYENEQFGKCPERLKRDFNVFDSGTPAFNGKAVRKQITLYFTEDTSNCKADLLLYTPANTNKPVPVFLMISFMPNSLKIDDPGIKTGTMWNRDGEKVSASEGRGWGFFDVEKYISEGIGVATIYYGDIEPDFAKGIKYGIRGHFLKNGQSWPEPDEWGTISAWAWGLSYVMDYLETDPLVDAKRVALNGVSRLGKTVLWTGARDQRFAMILASCSGEGGAALSMRNYGETIGHMIAPSRYFYQFCGNRAQYADNPETSPIDAHMLISLIAPRPLLLQTGDTDNWSDPKGEFLAAVAAAPVYTLLGKTALETEKMPEAGVPILNDLGYFMHSGGHGNVPKDFDIYLQFMKKHFFAQ